MTVPPTRVLPPPATTLDIAKWQPVIHAWAIEKGWTAKPLDTTARKSAKVIRIYSEIGEAERALRIGPLGRSPEFATEMADICYTTIQVAAQFGVQLRWDDENVSIHLLGPALPSGRADTGADVDDIALSLCLVYQCTTALFEYLCVDKQPAVGCHFILILLAAVRICQELDIDLERAMTLKHAYNETRPYRHGDLPL